MAADCCLVAYTFRRNMTSTAYGAFAWLSALLLQDHSLALQKTVFRDAVHLRYGWQLPALTLTCGCGSSFNVAHALQCPTRRFPSVRHNAVRDLLSVSTTIVGHDVSAEPVLHPVKEHVPCGIYNHHCQRTSGHYSQRLFGSLFEQAFFLCQGVFAAPPPSQMQF